MLIGTNAEGKAKQVKVTEEGALMVEMNGGGSPQTSSEKVLISVFEPLGEESDEIEVNAKVTSIDIANYGEKAQIGVQIDDDEDHMIIIGPNIATTLPINKQCKTISLVSTVSPNYAQIIVKGVE